VTVPADRDDGTRIGSWAVEIGTYAALYLGSFATMQFFECPLMSMRLPVVGVFRKTPRFPFGRAIVKERWK
jgi:hypothetical protein